MLVELKNVGLEQDGQSLLDGIDMQLKPGCLTVIVGNSGSGLTVLLKTLAGLTLPSVGQVFYDGVDLHGLKEEDQRQIQTRTGFMFQDAALWANMNVARNLDIPLQAKYPLLEACDRSEIVDQYLMKCGFPVDLNQRPVQYSIGQQKFLSFLRALIPGPDLLLLDEPLTGMDRPWIETVRREIKDLKDKKVTLALGSHNPSLWLDLTDHLVVLEKGKILCSGPKAEVLSLADDKIRDILAGCKEVAS